MKSDELQFAKAVLNKAEDKHVREVIADLDIPEKRALYLLTKWDSKHWYDYGVTIDLGWLTPLGVEKLTEIVNGHSD